MTDDQCTALIVTLILSDPKLPGEDLADVVRLARTIINASKHNLNSLRGETVSSWADRLHGR